MKLLRLYIQDSGVFNRTLIDLTHKGEPQDLVCLAGVNGCGKTTVMELLFHLVTLLTPTLSLRSIFFDRLKSHIFTRTKFAQLDVLIDGKVLSLVIGDKSDIVRDETNPAQAFIIESELGSLISRFEDSVVKIPDEKKEIDPTVEDEIKRLLDTERFSKRLVERLNIDIFQSPLQQIETALSDKNQTQRDGEDLPSVYFFNAHDREIQDIRYDSVPNRKPRYKLARRYHPQKDDLNGTFIYNDYAYPKEFEAIKSWINQLVLVDKQMVEIDRPNLKTLVRPTKKGSTHGLELLSSGEESLLIIATEIYLKVSRGSVVIIDEVDQSLHPEFQEKVMALLTQLQKDKGCQIIVSSHSDIVWNFFKSKGFISLTKMVM